MPLPPYIRRESDATMQRVTRLFLPIRLVRWQRRLQVFILLQRF